LDFSLIFLPIYHILIFVKIIAIISLLAFSGCAGYFAPTLAEHNHPIRDPAQCNKYYGSLTAPSWFNALALPGFSGIQTNAFGTFLLASNGGSTGSFDQAAYDRCSRKARENGYQGN